MAHFALSFFLPISTNYTLQTLNKLPTGTKIDARRHEIKYVGVVYQVAMR